MEKLADLKEVIGDPAHKLSHLLIVKKAEGQFLVMAKDFRAHVIFHAGAHHMSVVGNKVITVKFQNHQKEHEDDKGQNGVKGRLCIPVNYMGGDIAHDQRDDQGYGSGNSCKKHI